MAPAYSTPLFWGAALRQDAAKREDEHKAALAKLAELEGFKQSVAKRDEDARQDGYGRLVETRGLVLVLPEGQGKAVPVSTGDPIPSGRALWTCPWGAAAMRFSDGVSMDLDRSTVAALSETAGARQVALRNGILFVTRRGADKAGKVVINTSHASVTVEDAQVAVAAEANRTTIEVAEGEVQVTRASDRKAVTVRAGHYAIAEPGKDLMAVQGRLQWKLEPLLKSSR